MANVIISFDPDNARVWDLVLQLAEAGHKVTVYSLDELQVAANRIEVSTTPPEPEAPCPSQQ
jgi:hypothetical protein